MAVGPLVVAQDVDKGMARGFKIGAAREDALVVAAFAATLDVAVEGDEGDVWIVAGLGDDRAHRLDFACAVGHVAHQGEGGEAGAGVGGCGRDGRGRDRWRSASGEQRQQRECNETASARPLDCFS